MPTNDSNSGRGRQISSPLCSPSNRRSWRDEMVLIFSQNTTVEYIIGDSTLKDKRGRKHPLGHITRHSEHDPYAFGFEMVVLLASWDRLRIPLALVPIDPKIKGHQNILFRQMLKEFVPPAWVRQVVVVADAGFAANETL